MGRGGQVPSVHPPSTADTVFIVRVSSRHSAEGTGVPGRGTSCGRRGSSSAACGPPGPWGGRAPLLGFRRQERKGKPLHWLTCPAQGQRVPSVCAALAQRQTKAPGPRCPQSWAHELWGAAAVFTWGSRSEGHMQKHVCTSHMRTCVCVCVRTSQPLSGGGGPGRPGVAGDRRVPAALGQPVSRVSPSPPFTDPARVFAACSALRPGCVETPGPSLESDSPAPCRPAPSTRLLTARRSPFISGRGSPGHV